VKTLEQLYMYEIVGSVDLFPNEQNFDLDKSRQKFHHSLKEHHKISNIPNPNPNLILTHPQTFPALN
jgi:hypothetical protein